MADSTAIPPAADPLNEIISNVIGFANLHDAPIINQVTLVVSDIPPFSRVPLVTLNEERISSRCAQTQRIH